MKVQVQIVNAFIDGDKGGNPAGVVLNADALSAAQKQAVAKQAALSETAFVCASKSATFKLEFFTPSRQIAHCGHATVATFSLLRQLGRVGEGRCSKETIDGNREIFIDGDMAFIEQKAPTYTPISPESVTGARALFSLGLKTGQLLGAGTPCVVNTGNSFLLIALRSEAALKDLEPDHRAIEAVSEELDLIGYYVFTRKTKRVGRAAGTRMFAPRFGIIEEAGTGMAAGPLACFLNERMGLLKTSLLIEQGWFMATPSPSVVKVNLELKNGQISRLMAGGRAKSMSMIEVEI
jgi:PhzF family phenazine biosynthesis protein